MIEIILALLVGIWIGKTVTNALNQMAFGRILQELGVTEQQLRKLKDQVQEDPSEDDLEEIHIKLEQHQGQIYAFRVDNDGFLGQGTDRESLIHHLQQRMTNVRLIIDEGRELIKNS